jgi:hypothetical protein
MEKVDPMYIFNSKDSLIDISSDTRLKFSSQEAIDWLAVAGMFLIVLFTFLFICSGVLL